MQPNQLSCLALGVCFLWGHLRFITSEGDFIEIYRGPEAPSHSSLYNCVNVYVWVELYGDEPAGREMQLVLCHLKQTEPFGEHRRSNGLSGQTSSHNSGWDSSLPLPAGDGRGLSSCLWCIELTFPETRVRTDAPGLPQLQIVKPCQSVEARGLFYFVFFILIFVAVHLLSFLSVVLRLLSPVTRRKRRVPAWRSDRAKIKLFGSVTSLLARKDRGSWTGEESEGGVDQSIHHACAGLTQQKMEWWERPLGCKGPGNSNNIFWRLSDCPIWEADIWTI